MDKIVTMGGGTGHFQILRGLKNYECELTAVVNMCDDGGSSGRLRDEYGVLPPGDVRQCMIALSHEDESKILRELFKHRFKDGHNLGNLIITASGEICGDSVMGIKEIGRLLKIRGDVLPITANNSVLIGETFEGKILRGESAISRPLDKNIRIRNITYEPKTFIYREAAEKIRDADKIVICPGDLYGSILPNFIVEGAKEALEKSQAIKIYVCNLFTKEGNYDFKASDFVREIERYSGIKIDRVIVNTGRPSQEIINKYFSENSRLVEDDLRESSEVIRGEFVGEYLSEPKTILRHVPDKIAHAIFDI